VVLLLCNRHNNTSLSERNENQYKGITFNEEIIINALTEYFDRHVLEGAIDIDKFTEMFSDHGEKRENEAEMTEIKKITLEYLRNVLFSV